MKIVCEKSELAKGVGIVSKSVPSKTTMPILECILLEVSKKAIKLMTNDMELGIETLVEGNIVEPGKVALNAKIFSEIVRKLPDSKITIETDSNYQTNITCEKAKFNISAQSGKEFPELPDVGKKDFITISEFDLKEVVRQTIFSVANNNSNKIMAGELFDVQKNILKVVSLDGHRISIRRIYLADSSISKKVIVPGRTLLEISKIVSGNTKSNVDIAFTENHITFSFQDTRVVSRLVEGSYFQIEQMLVDGYETKTRLKKRDLLDCIDRATLLVKENDKRTIILNIQEGAMALEIKSQLGTWDEELGIEKEGKDLKIGFNPRFLMDALRVIDDDEVSIYFVSEKTPCLIKDEEKRYTYLILPINIKQAA
ncbi:DNA polymerase III subunit beta [Blautia pseudococcoides]|nr:DNA polymerase III subunit beta [Blautia pseudococcoides]